MYRKIVYIEILDYFTLVVALFLRLFKFEVYYVHLISSWQKDEKILFLEKLGIHRRNLNHFEDTADSKIFATAKTFADDVVEHYAKESALFQKAIEEWTLDFEQQEKFKQVMKQNIYTHVFQKLCKVMLFVELHQEDQPGTIFYILPKSGAYKLVDKWVRSRGILCFRSLASLDGILHNFCEIFIRYFRLFVKRTRETSLTSETGEHLTTETLMEKLRKHEVIYFPHKNIVYGHFFVKNYYYSSNPESPLFYKKVFHIFLGSTDPITKRLLRLFGMDFEENFLNYMFKRGSFRQTLAKFAHALLKDMARFFNLEIHYRIMLSIFFVDSARTFFRDVNHLKLCLLGYDQLFPREINLALSINGISVSATQERFSGFVNHGFMNHDYHFVWGPAMIPISEQYGRNRIRNYIPVGLPRLDVYHRYYKRQPKMQKYARLREKNRFFIVALDVHLAVTLYEDGLREHVSKRKYIVSFYKALIEVAKRFDVYVVIKGKTDNYYSELMKGCLEEIEGLPNIEIEREIEKYNSYKILSYFDLVIALHTSLAEEALAAGKNVIFYDPSGYLEYNFFPYNRYGLVAKDCDELLSKTWTVLDGGALCDKKALSELKQNYFNSSFNGKVRLNIQKYLESKLFSGK